MPKFSIITINYNNVSELEQTFSSAFNQTYKDFEYIVIDGGSTDGSKGLIEQHQANINGWISEPDHGVYDAMNKGIAKATGDYLYFLNSGDTFYNSGVLQDISTLIDQQQPDIVYGNVMDIDEVTKNAVLRPKNTLDKMELFHKMVCHQALFCHKKLFANNVFNTNYKIKADYDWLLHAFTLYKPIVFNTNIIIANYALGGLSDIQYNTYSVKEIPVIRNTYFTSEEQMALRRYVFNRKLLGLPMANGVKKVFKKMLQSKYQNLK